MSQAVASSRPVETPAWASEQIALRLEIREWITESMERQGRKAWYGIHDEGSMFHAWFGFYMATGAREVLDFLTFIRDGLMAWAKEGFAHGYYPEGEAHHQIETFIEFFCYFWPLDVDREREVAFVEDAAEHIGNWAPGLPEWYDWEAHRMRSWYIGSEVVKDAAPFNFESHDNARFIKLALNAFLATGRERYLDWACDYGHTWSRRILEHDGAVPMKFYPVEEPAEVMRLYFDGSERATDRYLFRYAHRYGVGWEGLEETFRGLCWGQYITLDALAELSAVSGEESFQEASAALLERGRQVYGAEPPTHWYGLYRNPSGDTRYDREILDRIGEGEAPFPTSLVFEGPEERWPQVHWMVRQEGGVLSPYAGPSASEMLLRYRVTGDREILPRAYALARQNLHMAHRTTRDGREHGCSGLYTGPRGREAGQVYTGSALGVVDFCATQRPEVTYHSHGAPGLPVEVAAILEPSGEGVRRVHLYNAGREREAIQIQVEGPGRSADRAEVEGADLGGVEGRRVALSISPETGATVEIQVGQG